MTFQPLDFVQFKQMTTAERDAQPHIVSLTAFNVETGFLESFVFDTWAIHPMLDVRPVEGDTMVYDASKGLFVPTPSKEPIVHSLRVYEDSVDTVVVKRFYRANTKTGAGTGTMRPIGSHTLAGAVDKNYRVRIDSAGTKEWHDATFQWSDTGGAAWNASAVPVSQGSPSGQQVLDYIPLGDGVFILFGEGTYTNLDRWDFVVIAALAQNNTFHVDTTANTVTVNEKLTVAGIRILDEAGVSVIELGNIGGDTELSFDPGADLLTLVFKGNNLMLVDNGGVGIAWPSNKPHLFEAVYHQFKEMATPSDPAANYGRFYAKDVGGLTLPHWKQGSTERAMALEGGSPTFDDLHVTDDADIDGDLNVDGAVQIDGNLTVSPGVYVNPVDVGLSRHFALVPDAPLVEDETDTAGDNPLRRFREGHVTTVDGVATTINTIPIAASKAYRIVAEVVGHRYGGTAGAAGDSASYMIIATFKNEAGTVTQVSTTSPVGVHENQAPWNVTFLISGTNVLVQVLGAGFNDIAWNSYVTVMEAGA